MISRLGFGLRLGLGLGLGFSRVLTLKDLNVRECLGLSVELLLILEEHLIRLSEPGTVPWQNT